MYALYPESAKFARISQDVTNLNRDLISNYGYVDIEQTGFEAGNVSIACHVIQNPMPVIDPSQTTSFRTSSSKSLAVLTDQKVRIYDTFGYKQQRTNVVLPTTNSIHKEDRRSCQCQFGLFVRQRSLSLFFSAASPSFGSSSIFNTPPLTTKEHEWIQCCESSSQHDAIHLCTLSKPASC